MKELLFNKIKEYIPLSDAELQIIDSLFAIEEFTGYFDDSFGAQFVTFQIVADRDLIGQFFNV